MAWKVTGQSLTMVEGDFGIKLPVTVSGIEFGTQDSIKVVFKTERNGSVLLEKSFTGIAENTFDIELTEAESALFPVGAYVYTLDWYQDGNFMCNIIPCADFKVVDKA
jgi:hypothetical protein